MIDNDLLQKKDACRERYLRPQPEGLRRWARSAGLAADAETAPINIHGVGIALKRRGGKVTDEPCIQVSVLRKLPSPEAVKRAGGTPIPRDINGILTDVVEEGPLLVRALRDTEPDGEALKVHRPLRPGCSISHGHVVFGTLGAFCKSTRSGEQGRVFLLSCRHVLTGFDANIPQLPIFQPGDPRGLDHTPVAVETSRFVDDVRPPEVPPRYFGDAAIAQLEAGVGFATDNLGIGEIAGIIDLLDLSEDDLLRPDEYMKFGRATGLTVGRLDVIRRDLLAVIGGGQRLFDDQFVIRRQPNSPTAMSEPGDSGAMVFHKDSRKAAGLVIGAPLGAESTEQTVISPLTPILRELEIELINEVGEQQTAARAEANLVA